jgi:hypothetical protein
MRTWIIVLLVGGVSYAFRSAPLFVERLRPRAGFDRLIADAGTASLVALGVLALRHQTVGVGAAATVSTVLALAIGIGACLRGWNMPLVTTLGVATQVVAERLLTVLV